MSDITLDRYKEAFRANAAAEARDEFRNHAIAFVVVNIFLAIFNLVVVPDSIWFYWSLFGWGIGLVFHYFSLRNVEEGVAKQEALAEARARGGT